MTVTVKAAPRRTKSAGPSVSKILMLCIFAGILIIPIIRMLMYITPEGLQKVFGSPVIGSVLLNTISVTAVATVITVVIAYLLGREQVAHRSRTRLLKAGDHRDGAQSFERPAR